MELVACHVEVREIVVLGLDLHVPVREVLVLFLDLAVAVGEVLVLLFEELDPLLKRMHFERAVAIGVFGELFQLGDLVPQLLVFLEQLLRELFAFFEDLEKVFDLFRNRSAFLVHHALLKLPR